MAPGFDADTLLANREPWYLTLGGCTYQAAWVSMDQVIAFFARWPEAITTGWAAERDVLGGFFRQLFPWRITYWWRGDPVTLLLALDREAREAILTDFFEWRGREHQKLRSRAMSSRPPTPPPTPRMEVPAPRWPS